MWCCGNQTDENTSSVNKDIDRYNIPRTSVKININQKESQTESLKIPTINTTSISPRMSDIKTPSSSSTDSSTPTSAMHSPGKNSLSPPEDDTKLLLTPRRVAKIEHYMPPWTYNVNDLVYFTPDDVKTVKEFLYSYDIRLVRKQFNINCVLSKIEPKEEFVGIFFNICRKYFCKSTTSLSLRDNVFKREVFVMFNDVRPNEIYLYIDCLNQAMTVPGSIIDNTLRKIFSVISKIAVAEIVGFFNM